MIEFFKVKYDGFKDFGGIYNVLLQVLIYYGVFLSWDLKKKEFQSKEAELTRRESSTMGFLLGSLIFEFP